MMPFAKGLSRGLSRRGLRWLLAIISILITFLASGHVGAQDTPLLGRIVTDDFILKVAQAPDADVAYGLNPLTRNLVFFNLDTYTQRGKITFTKRPVALAVHPQSNNAFVLSRGTLIAKGSLSVISPDGVTVGAVEIPRSSRGLSLNPVSNIAAVTFDLEKKVRLYSTTNLSLTNEISLSCLPGLVALDHNTNRAVIAARANLLSLRQTKLLTLDLGTGAIINEFHVPEGIRGLAVDSEKDIAVVVSFTRVVLVNINTGSTVATIPSSFSIVDIIQQLLGGTDPDVLSDLFFGVDVNPSTHVAVVTGGSGFLVINLNDNTSNTYQLAGGEDMVAVAVDLFRNSFLTSYFKVAGNAVEKGVLDIQLPNPVPEITSISPSETVRGAEATPLSIAGDLFVRGSIVSLGSTPLATTFTDNSNLQSTIPKERLAASGVFNITVLNPAPLGGESNAVSFAVKNPVPSITVLDPAQTPAGTPGLTVNILGSGFSEETTAAVNSQLHPATFVSATQLQLSLNATDLASPGYLEICVSNPAPGGGASNIAQFAVQNPVPGLTSVNPSSVKAGAEGVTLTLTGTGFTAASTVSFGGSALSATFVDPKRIDVPLPASLIASEGSYPITVTNPAPGGGTSNVISFTVTKASSVVSPADGSFGKLYEDLIPSDATIPEYDPSRFALMTGKVNDLSGNPVAAVAVTIHGRPQYGTARTDSSGRFSLPVDGGGIITLVYAKQGYITFHRQVNVPRNGFATAETVTMLAEDPSSTAVTFDGNSSTILSHKSTPVTDERGTRSLTMVFTGDNKAYVRNPDGTETQVGSMTVRATEYKTRQSMPAVLPPNIAYTYCSELSADGARNVRFEKPVSVYVNNFLGFDVGMIVPVGYYDRDRALWVPAENGKVVRLLDTNSDGIVDAYDDVGDGQTHGTAIGLTDPAVYRPGDTYWKVELNHFTPWDCNWPYTFPPDAVAPNAEGNPVSNVQYENDDVTCTNSYVDNRSCIFHEDIPVPGTDLTLHYSSNRTEGYKAVVTIPVSGSSVPPALKSIIVKMEVAGRKIETTLPPEPNQKIEYVWDGRDYLGRTVNGTTALRVSIGFVYGAYYMTPAPAISAGAGGGYNSSFGRVGVSPTLVQARQEAISWRESVIPISRKNDPTGTIAEGWGFDKHHYMNPSDKTVYKDDGTTISNNLQVIDTIAGNGSWDFSGDGGPATQAGIGSIRGIAVDNEGNIFMTAQSHHRIRKMDKTGVITTIAGTGQQGFSGDGGPATQAQIRQPDDVAVDGQGNIFIADTMNGRIRKINRNGIITTIAGGEPGICWAYSFEGSALSLCIAPRGVEVDTSGNVYVLEGFRVRKIDTNGFMTVVAGTGQSGFSGDGGPATQAQLGNVTSVAFDGAGNMYMADRSNNRIRKVDISGVITTVAGTGQADYSGDGGPATLAKLYNPGGVTVDDAGNIYIADSYNYRIRKVDTSGIISTIAGNGQEGFSGDGGPATQARMGGYSFLDNLAVDDAGYVYISDSNNVRLRKVFPQKGLQITEDVFPDENGLGYVMSSTGLHRSTIDLATGKTLRSFGYDEQSRLVSITDRFGNAVAIQRDGNGTPVSITSPYGIVTGLTVDGDNRLTSITHPDGSFYSFAYTTDGLLTDKYDLKRNHFVRTYNAGGAVSNLSDPEGGNWSYSRSVDDSGKVTMSILTALGNTTTYQDKTDPTGKLTSTTATPSGATSTFTRSADKLTEEAQTSCGTKTASTYGLDSRYKYRYLKAYSVLTPAGLALNGSTTKTYQDTNGDTIPDRMTTTWTVNSKNRVAAQNTLTGTITLTSPLGRVITSTYDTTTLLPKRMEIPGFLPLTYTYDAKGRVTTTTQGTRTTSFTYNSKGFIDTIVLPDTKTVGYTYDEVGRVKTKTLSDSTVVSRSYDANGNMTVLTNPKTVSYGFDHTSVDLRRHMSMPQSGTYTYTYDTERNLKTVTFPSGKQIVHTYSGGLLISTTTPEETTSYAYVCGTKLAEVTKGTEAITYTYDGSLLTSDTRTGTVGQTISYTHNNDLRLNSISYGGSTQSFTYDNDGLLTGASPYTITRNSANGLPTRVAGNTYALARTYSGYGEVDGITASIGGANRYSYTLTRDAMGRIMRKVETIGSETNTFDYVYDDNGRLKEVKKNSAVVESYSYDDNNNRVVETNVYKGITGRSSTYSDEDHLITSGSDVYQFSLDGLLTRKTTSLGTTSYVYSSRGELQSATLPDARVITYENDPAGRRIAKRVNGTIVEKYLWKDASTLLAVYDASDNLIARFTYADGRAPVSMTYNGLTYYILTDTIGSLRGIVDTSGNVVKRVDYDSFGNVITDSDPSMDIPLGFAGGLRDKDTGFVRFGARDYDPSLGRWTAKDPIDFSGGDTNLYNYVLNDPLNKVDPEGLVTIVPHDPVLPYAPGGGCPAGSSCLDPGQVTPPPPGLMGPNLFDPQPKGGTRFPLMPNPRILDFGKFKDLLPSYPAQPDAPEMPGSPERRERNEKCR